jgi:hypothetical protein
MASDVGLEPSDIGSDVQRVTHIASDVVME